MTPWRRVFREGIAPQLPLAALEALRRGLLKNDPRLRKGSTVEAGGSMGGQIIQACAIGYGGWQGVHLETPAEIEEFFVEVCSRANAALEDLAACDSFISWFDNNPRERVFPLLLAEVNRAIAVRTSQGAADNFPADTSDSAESRTVI